MIGAAPAVPFKVYEIAKKRRQRREDANLLPVIDEMRRLRRAKPVSFVVLVEVITRLIEEAESDEID